MNNNFKILVFCFDFSVIISTTEFNDSAYDAAEIFFFL